MMVLFLLEISLAESFCEEMGWIRAENQHQSHNQQLISVRSSSRNKVIVKKKDEPCAVWE